MAKKVTVQLVDDLNGGEAAETVTFGLDGVTYEIDLDGDNSMRLRDLMNEFTQGGRRVSREHLSAGPRQARRGTGKALGNRHDPAQLKEVRRWAREQGHQLSDRGRIPIAVMEGYQQAHAR